MTDRFLVPEGLEPIDVLATIATGAGRRQGPSSARTERRTILDTFDWRVHGAGLVLEHVRPRAPRPATLVLRPAGTTAETAEHVVVEGPPPPRRAFGDDLPAPLGDRLRDVVEMRAVVPVAELAGERREVPLLDDEGKTRVRVVVETWRLTAAPALVPAPDGRARPQRRGLPVALGSTLAVQALRGYEPDAARVASAIAAVDGVVPAGDLVATALAAAGHHPGSYSSKLRVDLTAELGAAEAIQRVLRHLLAAMDANLDGLRADLDSEFLHDYRVAVRRTRSVLGQARGVLGDDVLERFVPGWRWLGAVTSPTRDLDVWLLTLPELEADLPPMLAGRLAPLRRHLERCQRDSHAALIAAIDGPEGQALLSAWRTWLASPPATDPPLATVAVTDVAMARIWKAYRRVRDDGRAISPDSPGEHLHELRKRAKKLRYLLECYAPLFPADELKAAVRELKSLQDNLGTHQDCEVQADSLVGFADGLLAAAPRRDRHDTVQALLAMGCLVERIDERRAAARLEFAERFAAFDKPANQRRYRDLFRPDRPLGDVAARSGRATS